MHVDKALNFLKTEPRLGANVRLLVHNNQLRDEPLNWRQRGLRRRRRGRCRAVRAAQRNGQSRAARVILSGNNAQRLPEQKQKVSFIKL